MEMAQDPGVARRDVEEARVQLGQTVEALAYKANAPRRVARRIRSAPWVRIGAAAVAVGLIAAGVAVALHQNGR
jgi:ElaB/YqjD/DUF883 family membrane-anchored ribosome-binding protein